MARGFVPRRLSYAYRRPKLFTEADHLLTAAFPYLTLAQANAILTETEGPGGSQRVGLNSTTRPGIESWAPIYAALFPGANSSGIICWFGIAFGA